LGTGTDDDDDDAANKRGAQITITIMPQTIKSGRLFNFLIQGGRLFEGERLFQNMSNYQFKYFFD